MRGEKIKEAFDDMCSGCGEPAKTDSIYCRLKCPVTAGRNDLDALLADLDATQERIKQLEEQKRIADEYHHPHPI